MCVSKEWEWEDKDIEGCSKGGEGWRSDVMPDESVKFIMRP
jgi:hypothetical protein